MIQVTEIAFTGYPITDVPRARKFYEGVLGLKASMANEFTKGLWWIEYEIGAGTLALSNAWSPSGQSGPNISLEVTDLDGALNFVKAQNVPISYELTDSPICRFFGIKDPDGNDIKLHQRKTAT
jgi:predicted enzyme related to lactoylglutathione lyase